ncbi:actin-domain-containing protein [Phakopsora pachyrhizi]|nr:actin-domain-containing protein [Phakopsora pachyrhizi]
MISVKSDAISVGLRRLFSDQLMIDPRQRKVLLIENALLPSQVRDQIATVLFDQLHVPSISFTPSSVLILMASGSVTGLVVDVGHLETTVTPVYLSRPLFPHLKSTTRAGSRLSDRLKVLLARYGQFVLIPKFATSLASNSVTKIPKLEPVPINLLTPAIIEDIKTRVLFVSQNELQTQTQSSPSSFSQQQQQTLSDTLREDYDESNDSRLLEQLERVYKLSTSPRTKDVLYKLPSHQKLQSNAGTTCIGIMRIPGWIRERCAEILFNPTIPRTRQDSSYLKEEEEESLSITESILECLLKLPLDLRKVMVSNIIIAGGGAMLPGFTSRLRIELTKTLTDCHFEPINFERRGIGLIERKLELERLRKSKKRYSPISSLADDLLILNDRLPLPPSTTTTTTTTTTDNVITRPGGFQMNVLAWIGGSLAGSLRIGGQEIIRERWDSIIESSLVSQELDKEEKGLSKDGVNDELAELEEEGSEEVEWEKKLIGIRLACLILPEWTRMSLA